METKAISSILMGVPIPIMQNAWKTGKATYGYSTYLNDAPIFNKSKTQNNVTLNVSEAELVAAVECTQTMLFVRQI